MVIELPPFQPVARDFAFIVDPRCESGRYRARGAKTWTEKLISGVTVFDIYEGKGIDADENRLLSR